MEFLETIGEAIIGFFEFIWMLIKVLLKFVGLFIDLLEMIAETFL